MQNVDYISIAGTISEHGRKSHVRTLFLSKFCRDSRCCTWIEWNPNPMYSAGAWQAMTIHHFPSSNYDAIGKQSSKPWTLNVIENHGAPNSMKIWCRMTTTTFGRPPRLTSTKTCSPCMHFFCKCKRHLFLHSTASNIQRSRWWCCP